MSLHEFRPGLAELKAFRIEPCLPSTAAKPPSGPGWLHEIKYDGFRMMVRRDAGRTQVFTRNGYDWTARFPLMVAAAESMKAKSRRVNAAKFSPAHRGRAIALAS
jgi:ATP-dependent DNA ligase